MRYIIRKFVDADNVKQALLKEKTTPIHDCYLKDGEAPKPDRLEGAIGFTIPLEDGIPYEARKR